MPSRMARSSFRSAFRLAKRSFHAFAITREVPESFPNAITKFYAGHDSADTSISFTKARLQHDAYLKTLRKYVPTLCLPALDAHPDSVFVEDTVVVSGNHAVITNPGHLSRRGEVESIKEVLLQFGLSITDMRDVDCEATCDGGDVLSIRREDNTQHVFVGLSERTNTAGLDVLRQFLPDSQVFEVPFAGEEALHLKSIVTHMDGTTLLAPKGTLGDEVLTAMKAEELGYTSSIRLPDILSCNVVSVNGTILAQETSCEETRSILQSAVARRNMRLEFVDTSEMAKADGALTCCSILV